MAELAEMGFLHRLRRSSTDAGHILALELLLLTPDSDQEPRGRELVDDTREVSVVRVTDYDGLSVLRAFTSEAALLRRKPEGSRYIELQGKDVIELLARSDWDRMVVDTDSPDAFSITRAEAMRLLGS